MKRPAGGKMPPFLKSKGRPKKGAKKDAKGAPPVGAVPAKKGAPAPDGKKRGNPLVARARFF